MAEQIPTADEWVDQLLADAPPMTDEQRELAVRLLVTPPEPPAVKQPSPRRSPSRRAA